MNAQQYNTGITLIEHNIIKIYYIWRADNQNGLTCSGHKALEQRRNLVGIRSLRCSKLIFDIDPMCSARWELTIFFR